MDKDEYKNIHSIYFPNTGIDSEQSSYGEANGYTFQQVLENGEMAHIAFIGVFKDGRKIAQIRLTACNIFFKEAK